MTRPSVRDRDHGRPFPVVLSVHEPRLRVDVSVFGTPNLSRTGQSRPWATVPGQYDGQGNRHNYSRIDRHLRSEGVVVLRRFTGGFVSFHSVPSLCELSLKTTGNPRSKRQTKTNGGSSWCAWGLRFILVTSGHPWMTDIGRPTPCRRSVGLVLLVDRVGCLGSGPFLDLGHTQSGEVSLF